MINVTELLYKELIGSGVKLKPFYESLALKLSDNYYYLGQHKHPFIKFDPHCYDLYLYLERDNSVYKVYAYNGEATNDCYVIDLEPGVSGLPALAEGQRRARLVLSPKTPIIEDRSDNEIIGDLYTQLKTLKDELADADKTIQVLKSQINVARADNGYFQNKIDDILKVIHRD